MSNYIEASSKKKEYFKLFVIFAFLVGVATLMSTSVEFTIVGWFDWFIGTYFIVFGAFKLIHYEAFVREFPRYDSFASKSKPYDLAYPFIEILLGFLYIASFAPALTYIFTFVISFIGFFSVMRNLMIRGASVYATLLGKVIKIPLTTVLLITNGMMSVLALLMLVFLFIY